MTDAADTRTLELVVTNLALGLTCVALLAAVLAGVVAELLARLRGSPGSGGTRPPAPARSTRERTLAEMRHELPDCWPPTAEELHEEHALLRR